MKTDDISLFKAHAKAQERLTSEESSETQLGLFVHSWRGPGDPCPLHETLFQTTPTLNPSQVPNSPWEPLEELTVAAGEEVR